MIKFKFPKNAGAAEKSAAQAKAEAAYGELAKGVAFEEVARTRSEDTSSANGGDIGYFVHDTIKEMVGFQAAEALFSLKQPKAYTKPFEGKEGYYIFQLLEPPGSLDPNGLTYELKQNLKDQKKEDVIRSFDNEFKTRKGMEIVRNEPAIQEFLSQLQDAWKTMQGNSVEPDAGGTEEVEPAPAAGSTVKPLPGATAQQGATTKPAPGAPAVAPSSTVQPAPGSTAKPAALPGATPAAAPGTTAGQKGAQPAPGTTAAGQNVTPDPDEDRTYGSNSGQTTE